MKFRKMRVYYRFLLLSFSFFIPAATASAQNRVEQHLLNKRIDGLVKEDKVTYFLVVGDWGRNGQGDSRQVADWMGVAANQLDAKFVISTGDNFYCCGVASTDDHQWITSFENVFRSHSLQIPWYVALGNHDYQGSVQAQIDYTDKNQRWRMPARYFTHPTNDALFVFLDTSPFIGSYYRQRQVYPDLHLQDTTKQLAWADSVLSNTGHKWKIVVGHHPVYSAGPHGNEVDMMRIVEPRLNRHRVDLYLAGHDHSLQSLASRNSSVLYVISGGGAEKTRVMEDKNITRFAKQTTGFVVVGINRERIRLYFIDNKGKIIHKDIIEEHGNGVQGG